MGERYEVGCFEVVFVPWHSEYLAEDFMGVSIRRGGHEVFHAGMTKLVPSAEQAREIVETMTMLEEAVKVVGE
jgi:hypothetical protein